jgi:hypothetical protein
MRIVPNPVRAIHDFQLMTISASRIQNARVEVLTTEGT